MSSVDLVVLALGLGETYERWLVPMSLSVLFVIPSALVELVVVDLRSFKARFADELELLEKYYPQRYLVRETTFPDYRFKPSVMPNTIRFLETPQLPLGAETLVFIVDVDTLILDKDLVAKRREHLALHKLPFSNIDRGKATYALSGGRHVVRGNDYYTPKFRALVQQLWQSNACGGNDEAFLGRLCQTLWPHEESWQQQHLATVHGFHLSVNRNPSATISHGKKAQIFWSTPGNHLRTWRSLAESPAFRAYLTVCSPTMQSVFVDLEQKLAL